MNWQDVHSFRNGAMNGMLWQHSIYNIPWYLQNCYIDKGRIKTRPGHTIVGNDAAIATYDILAHRYDPNIHYAVVDDGSVGLFGIYETGTFTPKNKYTTGTVTISGTSLTFAGLGTEDLRTIIRGSNTIYFRVNNSGWSAWSVITPLTSTTASTAAALGNGSGLSYEICFGTDRSRGKIVDVGGRYKVGVAGSSPVVYDKILGKSWVAGIPTPAAPTATAGTATAIDDGWYCYAASYTNQLNQSSSQLSPNLTVRATVSDYTIDLQATAPASGRGTITFWRTESKTSSANAIAATKYFLCSVAANGGETVTVTDTAYDGNVDSTVEFSAGALFTLNMNAPSGTFYDNDDNNGYYGIAVSFMLYTGEEGPISERVIVRKTTDAQTITITMPATLFYAKGFNIYCTQAQENTKDAGEAQLYRCLHPLRLSATTVEILGTDDDLNMTLQAPLETLAWNEVGDFTGIMYSAGRCYVWGDDHWVRASGAVYYDINNGRSDGLDEPNYWNLQFQAGPGGDKVYSVVEFQNNVFALNPNDTYVLNRTNPRPDLWYFQKASTGFGCAVSNMACAGQNGIYAVQKNMYNDYEIRVMSGSGKLSTLEGLQATISSVTTFYCMEAVNGKIMLSTDLGVIVYNEVDGTWHVDTGLTVTSLSSQLGVVYAGDNAGDLFSMYTKAAGTAGDEGVYTYYIRSGAFNSGMPQYTTSFEKVWVRSKNAITSAHTATLKLSLDAYSTYATVAAGTAWSGSHVIPASTVDYIEDVGVTAKATGELCGLEISGTGGYGKVEYTGFAMANNGPNTGIIGKA